MACTQLICFCFVIWSLVVCVGEYHYIIGRESQIYKVDDGKLINNRRKKINSVNNIHLDRDFFPSHLAFNTKGFN